MVSGASYKWQFVPRFRRHAFGWRSQPAIKRIKEAVAEIRKVAKKNPILAGEGAVVFLEKVSAAIELVDSSSGAIGSAVNNAIEDLVSIIVTAQADAATHDKWLKRLWEAVIDDQIPYLESVPDYWGDLCVTAERASGWADELIETVRMAWGPNPITRGNYKGMCACFSALLKAGRNDEILEWLALAPFKFWSYHQWGVKALAAKGKVDEALRYAENSRGLNDNPIVIAQVCEEMLLAGNRTEEAYHRYAIKANEKLTYLNTYRAIKKKYPHVEPARLLNDLVASTPSDGGKWFASAISEGLYGEAVKLAYRSPCDPRTLTRAARDLADKEPLCALEYGMAALLWLAKGYGYEITDVDVRAAYNCTLQAAKHVGLESEMQERIRGLITGDLHRQSIVAEILSRDLAVMTLASNE